MSTITTTNESFAAQPQQAGATRPAAVAGITPGDVLKILRRSMIWILVIWLLSIAATVGGTYVWAKYWPSFGSFAYIQVRNPNPSEPFDIAGMPLNQDLVDRFVRDEAMKVKSNQTLRRSLEDPLLRETMWFQQFDDPDEALLELDDELGAGPQHGTSYVRITFSTHEQDDSAKVINAIVDSYMDSTRQQSSAQFRDQANQFSAQLNVLKDQRNSKLDEIMNFQKDAGIPGMTDRVNAVGLYLQSSTLGVMEAQEEKLSLKGTFDSYAQGAGISPEVITMVENDPRVYALSNRLLFLQEELGVQVERCGPNHRTVSDLQRRVTWLDSELARLRDEKMRELHQARREQITVAYNAAVEKEVRWREEQQSAKAQQRELDEKLSRYLALQEELRIVEERYAQVDQHMRDLQIILNTRQGPQISVAARAVPPLQRTSPRWMMNMAGGVFLGLLLGVGVAVLREFVDTTLRTPRDVVRHTSLPLLGIVPTLDQEEIVIDDIEMATRVAPNSMVAESFRQMRTNLFLSSAAENQRSLLVTSAGPEDGKTAVAVNLAVTVAQSGRRVLLVDANFRRPALHTAFNAQNHDGLSNVLVGQKPLAEAVVTTDVNLLDILPSGPIPPNPVELLSSKYMQDLIADASKQYDQIIFDGPPALLVSDPLVLGSLVDATIIVCHAQNNSRGALLRTRDQLEAVNAHIIGVVLNAVEATRGGYYRQQYRSFYDYMGETAEQVTQSLPTGGADNKDDQA